MELLTTQNAKTTKGEELGYLTGILYLAPSNTVKGINTCPKATKGCREACLYTAGRGAFSNVQQARIRKTELFRDNPIKFMEILISDISKLNKKALKLGKKPCVRLNGTSDIDWQSIRYKGLTIFEHYPDIQFYDYTKVIDRVSKFNNYSITLSKSEHNKIINSINNIAIVFDKLPDIWMDREVINGDEHDLRFLDKLGVIVGLTAKGKAKKDKTGFVIRLGV